MNKSNNNSNIKNSSSNLQTPTIMEWTLEEYELTLITECDSIVFQLKHSKSKRMWASQVLREEDASNILQSLFQPALENLSKLAVSALNRESNITYDLDDDDDLTSNCKECKDKLLNIRMPLFGMTSKTFIIHLIYRETSSVDRLEEIVNEIRDESVEMKSQINQHKAEFFQMKKDYEFLQASMDEIMNILRKMKLV